MSKAASKEKCPVCDYDLDESAIKAKVQGREIRVCCEECRKALQASPEKYARGK
ncbi:MAG: hypothetical protein HS101_08835 [Planctomycetia bacterium]|jgi:YHS domain-containing protein|nr:hypothetical protein [Planctomycetia bacterium]MCC7315928.1 hypothetical protein [Planctomycetota bacterium]